MPGLVGFVKNISSEQAQSLLKTMAHALESESRFNTELYHNDGFGLGRVTLGIVNAQPQPVWNEAHTLCLALEGELYNAAEMAQRISTRPPAGDAELILRLYEQYGDDAFIELNGAFAVAIWDTRAQKLTIANDRLGLFPLYYTHTGNSLHFGSGVRALLADPALSREIDFVAINEFLVFDHVFNDRTLLANAHLLPQASVLTFNKGQLNIHPYWTLTYPQEYKLQSLQSYIEQLNHYLRQAITRQAPGDIPAGMLLSGGLDSRALLAILQDGLVDETFNTFTWGIPGSDDVRFAKELAAKAGVRHQYFELKPDWLLHMAEEGVRATDGLGNIINLHAMATLKEEAEFAKIIYKGFLGDAMFGFALKPQFWGDYPPHLESEVHLQVHHSQGVTYYTPAEQLQLLTPAFQERVGTQVMDDYRAGMQRSGVKQLANQRLYFDLTQRVPRMTIKGVEVARNRTVVRLPFADNDLLNFALTVPPGFLYGRQLMQMAFLQTYPSLAQIPMTGTGLPMVACMREIRIRTQRLLRWHLKKIKLDGLLGAERRPYKDYNNWFRTVLREWVERILLSEQSLNRGYFQPDYVRTLVSTHMAGADHTGRLGALLTLELWHKQFID